jgi:hypothetical protein
MLSSNNTGIGTWTGTFTTLQFGTISGYGEEYDI